MKTLDGLGWQWHKNGVVLCVSVLDGTQHQKMCVFVPLERVWAAFHKEMAAVGYPLQLAAVGEPVTVSGLFGSISHAFSSAAHSVTHAVSKAATSVANTAKRYGQHALDLGKGVVQNKYFRTALDAAAFAVPALAPAAAALEVAHRALDTYQQGLDAAKRIKAGLASAVDTAKVAEGLAAHAGLQQILQHAKAGNKTAQQIVGALQQHIQHATTTGALAPHALALQSSRLLTAPAHGTRTYSYHDYAPGGAHAAPATVPTQLHRARVQAALHAGKNVRFARAS